MKLNEILNKILTQNLKSRLDELEKNYSCHTLNIEKSFNLIEEIKIKVAKINSIDNHNTYICNNDLSKSFLSTSSRSNFNKSKITYKRPNSRGKTPFKKPTNTKINTIRKSEDNNIKNTKSVVKNCNTLNTSNINNKSSKSIKIFTSMKSSSNLTSKKSFNNYRGVSADKLNQNLSRTPQNSNISPLRKKNVNYTRMNTPINNSSPDILRHKSQTKLKKTLSNNNFLKTEDNLSNSGFHNKSKTRDSLNNINRNNEKLHSNKRNINLATINNKSITKSNNYEFEKDFNVSKIIAVEGGLHDESLINNKEDLLMNCDDGELEFLTKQISNQIVIRLNTPIYSSHNLIVKEIKLEYEEVLDDKWCLFTRFFNLSDHIKIILVNKKFGRYTLLKLISNIEADKLIYEERLNQAVIASKLSSIENKENDVLVFSRGTNKAVDLLNENIYSKIFSEETLPKSDILLVYRLFFQIIKDPIIKHFNSGKPKTFWIEACKYFMNDSQGKADSSNENIYQIFKILGNNLNKINPNYFSKMCGTTGLINFFIKDVLDFLGISTDNKKTSLLKSIKTINFVIALLNKYLEKLKGIINIHFN